MQFDFLLCSERSGSNLITKIIDSHPDICGPFPRHAVNLFAVNYYKYGDINNNSNWEILVNDLAAFMNSGFSIWKSKVTAEMIFKNVKIRSLAEIFKYIYEHEALANGKKRVFIKENHAYRVLPFTLANFHNAKYVYVVRDPRDMALCWKENTVYGGVQAATKVWLKDQQENLKVYGYLKDLNRVLMIKFEDLISNTETTVNKTCDFLNIAYDEKMLDFHNKDVVKANAEMAITGGWDDLAKPIIKDNFNNYKTRLSESEIKYIENLCNDEMEYFGYQKDFPYEADLDSLEKKLPDESTLVDKVALKKRRSFRSEFHDIIDTVEHRKLY